MEPNLHSSTPKHRSCTAKKVFATLTSLFLITSVLFLTLWIKEKRPQSQRSPPDTIELVIMHTNDQHGHFEDHMLVQREYIKAANRTDGFLLLSAGDINTGVPESDLLHAAPDFQLHDQLHYMAMTLGNHEFDRAIDVLHKQKKWAGFPFLGANVFNRSTNAPLFDSYLVTTQLGVRIGIFGVTTEETAILAMPDNVRGVEFKPALPIAREVVAKLREVEKVKLVIALTHIGYYNSSGGLYDSPGDILLASSVPGIDLIIGGHSHTALPTPQIHNNVIVVQAGAYGKYIGELRLFIDKMHGSIVHHKYRLHAIGGVGWDRFVDTERAALRNGSEQLSAVIGKTLVFLDGERMKIRSGETNLGNLLTDMILNMSRADIVFYQGGGIRASIPAGPIAYRQLLQVLPFGNEIVVMELTLADLQRVLDHAATMLPGSGGWLHGAGFQWTLERNRTASFRNIDPKPVYKVATNQFMAAGGDGYPLSGFPTTSLMRTTASLFAEYLTLVGPVNVTTDGRFLNRQTPAVHRFETV
eukprot:NODE_1098_length_1658_cov_24.038537_g1031_i0.p1 GENE.NODE_1098_length_1658_cov_24.038537_g1031_i0~~NODE_1098_length_1658_cov_24.038537_g1031_i0.p1  ORF type:complete len:544 (+),score=162.77 NODE_1098_length_1658_cov_24.038537_g1031_i0:49-1632(+)